MELPWIPIPESSGGSMPSDGVIPWIQEAINQQNSRTELTSPPVSGMFQDSIVKRARRLLSPVYTEIKRILANPQSIDHSALDNALKSIWAIQADASAASRIAGMLAPFAPQLNSKVPARLRPDPIKELELWPVAEAGLNWLIDQVSRNPNTIFGVVNEEQIRASVMGAEVDSSFIDKLNRELFDSIQSGEGRDEWSKRLAGIVDTKIGFDEVISSTAAHRAFIAGQEEILEEPELEEVFPYRQYLATMDNRIRERHAGMNKKVFHKNSPLFDYAANLLNEYRCRCSLVTLTAEDAESIGISPGGEQRFSPSVRFRDRVYGNPANRPMDV